MRHGADSRLAATLAKAEWMLTTFVFPHIGGRPIGEIAAPDVLRLLRRIEARGKHGSWSRPGSASCCGRSKATKDIRW
jgi:Phage integrase central domain